MSSIVKKKQRIINWIKKSIYYLLFVFTVFCFCLILSIDAGFPHSFGLNFSLSKNLAGIQKTLIEFPANRAPSSFHSIPNSYMIPAGTQMVIPPWIVQQYELSQQRALYGDVLNFLIHNYGVAAPSDSDEKKDTYYIPLSVYDSTNYEGYDDYDDYSDYDNKDNRARDTVMIDITKLNLAPQWRSGDQGTPPVDPKKEVTDQGTPPVDPKKEVTDQGTPPDPKKEVKDQGTPPVDPKKEVTDQGTPPDQGKEVKDQGTPPDQGKEVTDQGTPPVDPKKEVKDQGTPPVDPKKEVTDQGTPPVDPKKEVKDQGRDVREVVVGQISQKIDQRKVPSAPTKKQEKDLSKTYPVSCDKTEMKTAAEAPCVTCIGAKLNASIRQVKGFLHTVNKTVKNFGEKKNFPSLMSQFCKHCGVDIQDFIEYVEQRARDEKVPPEILLSIMMRESFGDCNAKGDRKKNGTYKSYGLFQLNVGNSTNLKMCSGSKVPKMNSAQMKQVCQNGDYRKEKSYKNKKDQFPGRCLNNPYCNFEESIHLLTGEKWAIGNKRNGSTPDKPEGKSWGEMEPEERNLWRNAIIAYNGAAYVKPAERAMKSMKIPTFLDNWEIKRMFFVRNYLSNKSEYGQCGKSNRSCKARYNPQKIVHNLAYVERIAGRETPESFADSSICQWTQFRKSNLKLSCDK